MDTLITGDWIAVQPFGKAFLPYSSRPLKKNLTSLDSDFHSGKFILRINYLGKRKMIEKRKVI